MHQFCDICYGTLYSGTVDQTGMQPQIAKCSKMCQERSGLVHIVAT